MFFKHALERVAGHRVNSDESHKFTCKVLVLYTIKS